MKTLLVLFTLGCLVGCQTRKSPPPALPKATEPPAAPVSLSPPAPHDWEQQLRQQRQLAEALMSQNDALQAQLREALARTPQPVPVNVPTVPALPADLITPQPAEPPINVLMPNAEGLIDLIAARAGPDDKLVNPFAVRLPSGNEVETVLRVQGVVTGKHPCALVNDQLVSVGDTVEMLRLERIETRELYFTVGRFTLKIPVGGQPVRIRRT